MVVDEFIYTVKQFGNEIKSLINATLCNTSLFYQLFSKQSKKKNKKKNKSLALSSGEKMLV